MRNGLRSMVAGLACAIAGRAALAVDIQQLVNDAIASGASTVTIPAGVHEIDPPSPTSSVHLSFNNATDLVIDGSGGTWVFTDPAKGGIAFNACTNVTFRNVTLDYDPLPHTQGEIVAINSAQRWIEVDLHAGYPADPNYFTDRLAAYTYDPATRLIKPGSHDLYPTTVTVPRPGVFRLAFTSSGGFQGSSVGDLLLLSRRAAGGIRINNSEGFAVEDVTIWAAPGIAIQEAGGVGDGRYTYTVTRGPTPGGATEPRLHSANADAFHSSSVQNGPTVEDCLFEYMGDDAIAIHNNYSIVCSEGNTSSVIVSPKWGLPIFQGDTVTFLDGDTYAVSATATVQGIQQLPAPPSAHYDEIEAAWAFYRGDADDHAYYTLQLDRSVNVAVGDLASSPNRTGGGFVVRNNTIRNHRARGLLIKSGPGLIEHNVIDGSSFAGIALGPEIVFWLGGDYAQNVTVRDNVVRNTGYHASALAPTNLVGAGIVVHAAAPNNQLSPGRENRDLLIENNAIEDTGSVALLVLSARDTVVRNNRIAAPVTMPNPTLGTNYGVNPTAAVYIDQTQNVSFENNTIDLEGGQATAAVALGPNAGVVNADAGLRVVTRKVGVNFAADRAAVGVNDALGIPGLTHTHWNNAFSLNGTMNIADSQGNYAGSMNWIGDGTFYTPISPANADGQMMRGYLYRDGPHGATVTVSGLPTAFANGYDLVVYYDSTAASVNTGQRIATVDYNIDGDVDTSLPYASDASLFAGDYVEAPAPDANYFVIRSAASVGTSQFRLRLLRAAGEADTERGAITGLQIIGLE